MSGQREAISQYGAEGTAITLQIESWKDREQWREARLYVFNQRKFDSWPEARQAELDAQTRPKPYDMEAARAKST